VGVIRTSTRRVFTQRLRSKLHLPRLAIPRWTRAAPQIQEAITRFWAFEVILVDFLTLSNGGETLVLAELRDHCGEPDLCEPYMWAALDDVADLELADSERQIIRALIQVGSTGRGTLSHIGWMDEALKWTASAVDKRHKDFEPRVSQLKVGPASALLRFDYPDGARYWLKAAGGVGSSEFGIVAALSNIAPEYIPVNLGFHSSWKAWLMEDAGQQLGRSLSLRTLESVGIQLADLQRATEPHVDRLLQAGCDDQRPITLFQQTPVLMNRLKEAMRQTGAGRLKHVTDMRLDEIGEILSDACSRLASIQIPTTLVHNDISLENILVQGEKTVFIDWEEGAVGFPFVSVENLGIQLAQENVSSTWLKGFSVAYRKHWDGELDKEAMRLAYRFLPILAVVSYAWSRSEWLLTSREQSPESNAHARVLARWLDRFARGLRLPKISCVAQCVRRKRQVVHPTVCS
jgi:hypothetical protein